MLLLTSCSMIVTTDDIVTEEEIEILEKASIVPVETFGTVEDGFCLTYPASFELTDSSDDYYKFTDSEQGLSISLSIQENTYTNLSAEEYPQAMGLEMYSKMLSDNSFDRDVYVKDDQSYYSIYTLTDEYIYCVEYCYQGEPGQDSLINQLDFEAYGKFSGTDDIDTLMSYAQVHLEDLMGSDSVYTLTYDGNQNIGSYELTVFQVYENDDLISLIAVNSDGICYVDHSATGERFVNIEILLYDTTETTMDRLLYYAMYYYKALYGTAAVESSVILYNADYYHNSLHLTVYDMSGGTDNTCLIGVTDDGVGYVDYSGTGTEFEKIEQ